MQLGPAKPDFGAICQGKFRGWIELKKPNTALEPETWTGHNARQWENLKDLDNLLISNGSEVRWFRLGELAGEPVALPRREKETWKADPLVRTLQLFLEGQVQPIVAVSRLAERLAPLARNLRDRVVYTLVHSEAEGHAALTTAMKIWRARLQDDADETQFADATAQVVAYSLVIAALDGNADTDDDGTITIDEARDALRNPNRVLAAALGPIIEVTGLLDAIKVEVGSIERLVSGVDAEAIRNKKDPRGEPWLWFYEDFLAKYDPEARKNTGVYYTPIEVVQCITRLISHELVNRFDKRLGFADSSVTTLDPACGTGTFPLAVVDDGVELAVKERGKAGQAQAASTLAKNLFGFELLAGPYAVAHLRIAQRLVSLGAELPETGVNVLLADTFASPDEESVSNQPLWGDDKVLADERERARKVKRDKQILVVLGNPPYDRVEREGSGGWVLHGDSKTPADEAIFAEVLRAANAHTIFSHVASLYNLYAYFWRWAMWKAFEAHGDGPAVVGFITGSHWLRGPGFIGLRQLALDHADEIVVIDLGGDNKGAIKDENIFAIETPVAITLLVRHGASDASTPAQVHYRRIEGSSSEKLAQLSGIEPVSIDDSRWQSNTGNAAAGFVPATGSSEWQEMPLLSDVFPWQQPGQMTNRNWPIAPSPELLVRRWKLLMSDPDPQVRADRFVTAKTGRNINTKVGDLPKLADLALESKHLEIARYGWRSFDRQWTFADPRLANLERPALWQSRSSTQVFLVSNQRIELGSGPACVAYTDVPDRNAFRGSAGGVVFPMFRDNDGHDSNVCNGLAAILATIMGIDEPTTEDVFAYAYALLSSRRFQQRFSAELQTPGVRLPFTRDATLWRQAVEHGEYMIWLHTYAQRFRDADQNRTDRVPIVDGLGWDQAVKTIPHDLGDVAYDASGKRLHIGDGVVVGVEPEVWEYAVSGMQVVRKWLGYRTAKGTGRAASSKNELDRIRPEKWADDWNDELLDLLRILTLTVRKEPEAAMLVDQICDGDLIPESELPKPSDEQRKVPKTQRAVAPSLFDSHRCM